MKELEEVSKLKNELQKAEARYAEINRNIQAEREVFVNLGAAALEIRKKIAAERAAAVAEGRKPQTREWREALADLETDNSPEMALTRMEYLRAALLKQSESINEIKARLQALQTGRLSHAMKVQGKPAILAALKAFGDAAENLHRLGAEFELDGVPRNMIFDFRAEESMSDRRHSVIALIDLGFRLRRGGLI